MDVTNQESVAAAVAKGEARLAPIDILVNNAGTVIYKNAVDCTVDDYEQITKTNERGAFLLAQAVGRSMINRNSGGKIINISSVSAYRGFKQLSIYSMSKAAILQMTRALCLEWARYDIQVNAIVPGYIRTEINDEVWATEIGERIKAALPRRRVGSPEDLDGALLLLASNFSQFMSGTAIVVDDGHSAVDLC
jgi:NAD(P)-dependent dehydrogenase (short-subunit alcohol dehydrogenase family)